eukprot:c19747_g3_i2.p1 GENE.c19747_g3_i2~~c19747_g3_i2.p1  ORF type:complete len:433 (+),score=79.98 c19747_g3_i2:241-1539(+)
MLGIFFFSNSIGDTSRLPTNLEDNKLNYVSYRHLMTSYPSAYCEADTPDPKTFVEPSVPSKLISIQVVVRHGDRTPCTPEPKDDVEWRCDQGEYYVTEKLISTVDYDTAEYDWNRKFWKGNCADGQLTPRGFEQHMALGDKIFQTYSSRIPIEADGVYARSTIVPRARQSAQAFLFGMLKTEYSGKEITVQTSPYHKRSDIMLGSAQCSRLNQMQSDYRTTPEWKAHLANNQDLKSRLIYLYETANSSLWQDDAFEKYYDTSQARYCHNQPMPCMGTDCLTEAERQRTVELGLWEWDYRNNLYRAPEKSQLEIGPLLFVIATTFQKSLDPKSNITAVRLYSGHDDTVSPLLSALGLHLPWPPYASNVVFELWQPVSGKTVPFVRMRYNGELQAFAPCNALECPLDLFFEFIEPFGSPSNYAAKCATPLQPTQ